MKHLLSILCLCGFAATACSKSNSTGERVSSTEKTASVAGEEPTVRLIDAGASADRETLRYKFKVGHTEPMVMRMKMGMDMDVPGMGQQKIDMPVMVMRMTTKIKSIEANGNARLSFSIDSADVEEGGNPMMAQQIQSLLSKFAGIKGEYGISTRGITSDTSMDMTGISDPQVVKTMGQMRQSMEQASSPLPEEPVGAGARWEVSQIIRADGMQIRQKVEYTLGARDGDVVTLTTKLNQDADKQTISTPEMNGVVAQLESYKASGSGTLKTDLAGLVPVGVMELKNKVVMSTQGQKMTMGLTMKVDIGNK
jgi:hypothetical protein